MQETVNPLEVLRLSLKVHLHTVIQAAFSFLCVGTIWTIAWAQHEAMCRTLLL